jgi:Asp-tRNA(Asn)/Glu-tRNA(Gln) amidotransferase A subunit family amidase
MDIINQFDLSQLNKNITLTKLALIVISFFSLKKILSLISKSHKNSKALAQGKTYREKRNKKIVDFLQKHKNSITKERTNTIISLDASSLLSEIHSQSITSFEATLAYSIRAAEHGLKNNWITEVLFEEALEEAKMADEHIKKNNSENKKNLSLGGLPISIKDNFNIKNHFSTIGICAFTSDKNKDGSFTYLSKEDGYFVKVMREKGAVIYVKTNTPQNMLACESSNNLWGPTKNPWDETRTCGGSTGGEAGLIGGYCSPMGIGTDIGGSIRIPSVFCGIYGFKPTASRLSRTGQVGLNGTNFSPNLSILPVLGPMARSSRDLVFMMRELFGSFKDDCYINNSPFNEDLYSKASEQHSGKKAKIAFITSIKHCEFAPELKAVMADIKQKLLKIGFSCEELSYNYDELLEVGKKVLINSGAPEGIERSLKDETPMNYYQKYFQVRKTPNFLIKLLGWISKILGNDRMADICKFCLRLNQEEFLYNVQKLQELKSAFVQNLSLNNYDAIICPVMPHYASKIGTGDKLPNFIDLSLIFNLIDMPSGVVPITISEGGDYKVKYIDDCSDYLKENCDVKGLPVCVQVAALPGKDEISLRILEEIDQFYRFDKNHLPKMMEKFN